MMRKVWWGLGGLLTASAIVGVGVHLQHPPARAVRTASAPSAPASISPVSSAVHSATETAAPAFQVASLNAGTVRVPMAKPTVVYFMSASCGSCISGEQQLAHLAAKMPASVQWLSLDVDPGYDTRKDVLSMARYTGAHWPQAFGTNAIINAYHVTALDMVAVIAKNGALLYDGALPSSSHLRTLIQQAEA